MPPPDSNTQALPWWVYSVGGSPDSLTGKPGHDLTWHLSCPSAYREPYFTNQGSRTNTYQNLTVSQCVGWAPVMSLRVIMFTWTCKKTTKLIYVEADLLRGKTARDFIALLTFTRTTLRGQTPVKADDGFTNMTSSLLRFNCFLLNQNSVFCTLKKKLSH